MTKSMGFYSDLPEYSVPIVDLLGNERLFANLPKSWHVVVVRVHAESNILKTHHFNNINLAVNGCISLVLDRVKETDNLEQIPLFFGGSEATFIVPYRLIKTVTDTLKLYESHLKKTYALRLDLGNLSVKLLYKKKKTLKIAKLKLNESLTIPIVLGNGLKYARSVIKNDFDNDNAITLASFNNKDMDFRWHEILPSDSENNILCLFIQSTQEKNQANIYRKIFGEIEFIFGDYNTRNPINISNLKFNGAVKRIRKELIGKLSSFDIKYLGSNWLISLFGTYYFKFFSKGRQYLHRVAQLSGSLKIDGNVSTVIMGNQNQISRLRTLLDELESKKLINYGIHISKASIISCRTTTHKDNLVNFIDGMDGGFKNAELFCLNKIKKVTMPL